MLLQTRLARALSLVGAPLLRHGVFVVVMVVLAVTASAIVGRPSSRHGFFALQLFVDIYLLAALLCLLPHRVAQGLKALCYVLAYSLAFVETYLYLRFHLFFSPTMLNLLFETNGGEASEFVALTLQSGEFWQSFLLYTVIGAGHLAAALWGFRGWKALCHRLHVDERNWAQRLGYALRFVAIPLVASLGLVVGLSSWVGEKQRMLQFFGNEQTREAEKVSLHSFYSPFYRLAHAAHFLQIARDETELLMDRMQQLQVDSVAGHCPNIIVVIGESYNKHHASIYGYPLPTTPKLAALQRQGSLVVFDDVITPWNVTSQCFQSFLSPLAAAEPGAWTDGVLFPNVFRRAGYKVAFVTNQFYRSASHDVIDFNGSFFLNDERMDSLCFDFRNKFRSNSEGNIMQLLKGYAAVDRNLYVLHLLGQHMDYSVRYPKDRAIFSASDIDRPDLSERERSIVAHYANATRYNDSVVWTIIRYFRHQDAILLYFADHGEEVYDHGQRMYGRNHMAEPTADVLRNEYEIPFMFWASRRFRQRHPAMWQRIRAARRRPFSHDDLPHLLFGLAGIATSYYQPARDPLSDEFRPQRRVVKQGLDYDSIISKSKGL